MTSKQQLKALNGLLGNIPKNFFSERELLRNLDRNKTDLLLTAKQLKTKYDWLNKNHYINLTIADCITELEKDYIRLLPEVGDHSCRPIIIFTRRNFIPKSSKTTTEENGKTIDGSSTLDDALQCIIYIMQKAIEELEELDDDIDGICLIIDFLGCTPKNFNVLDKHKIDSTIFHVLQSYYPNTLHKVYLLNTSNIIQGMAPFVKTILSKSTTKKLCIVSSSKSLQSELFQDIEKESIPNYMGGTLEWLSISQFIIEQGKLENIEPYSKQVNKLKQSNELIRNIDSTTLKGMQYSGKDCQYILNQLGASLHGPLYLQKIESNNNDTNRLKNVLKKLSITSTNWLKCYGILRPDAILIYETITSNTPYLILSLTNITVENIILTSNRKPTTGSFGFKINIPNTPSYIFAALSEKERAKWLQAIEVHKSEYHDLLSEINEENNNDNNKKGKENEEDMIEEDLIGFYSPTPQAEQQQQQQQQGFVNVSTESQSQLENLLDFNSESFSIPSQLIKSKSSEKLLREKSSEGLNDVFAKAIESESNIQATNKISFSSSSSTVLNPSPLLTAVNTTNIDNFMSSLNLNTTSTTNTTTIPITQNIEKIQLFPAGLINTNEFGTQWNTLNGIFITHAICNMTIPQVQECIKSNFKLQFVDICLPTNERLFHELIYAGRFCNNGIICLLHFKIESKEMTLTCKSISNQYAMIASQSIIQIFF